MSIVSKKYVFFLPLLFFSVFSCKKDVDDQAPRITFSAPVENQSFNVNDDVHVIASVSDNVKLDHLSISLQDMSHNPVHVTTALGVSSPSMTLDCHYLLDNIHLSSGYYFIALMASDGEHDTYAYRQVYITAVPRVLKNIYMFSNSGSAPTNLSLIDTALSAITPFHTFSGDYLGSNVSSYHQQAYVCGNYSGDFIGLILQYNSNRFLVPALTSATPYFTGFYSDEQNSFVSRYDETIKGYNYLGSGIYNATAVSGFYGQHMCFNSDRVIVEQQEKVTTNKKLVTYFNTGAQEQNCNLYQDVVAFCEKDNSNVFVFGNSAGQGIIQLYDRAANNLWSPYPFPLPTGTILSVLQLDPDNYLIGHSNGNIYHYQYSINSVTLYMSGYTAIKMKYDDIADELYIVEANKISTFAFPLLTPRHTITSAETILDVHLLYNR